MERTWPAKNRIKFDVIDFFFQEDPCMDLTFTLIWNLSPEMHADKIQQKQIFCQIANCTFEFQSFDNFFSNHHVLSVVLSFFCQIVMGSPFNNNVPEGRSVQLNKQYLIWKLTYSAKIWDLIEVAEAHTLASGGTGSDRGQNEKKLRQKF